MFYQKYKTNDKYSKICKLNNDELLDRIQSFPDQNLLNNFSNGDPRKFQIGIAAEQYSQKPLDDNTRIKLMKSFSSVTTMPVETCENPNMPDNVDGYALWDFYSGSKCGQKISFGLMREAPGKIAVSVPTTDLTTVKIGYLNEQFVNNYPINDDCIIDGQWYKGNVELIFDVEKLYADAKLEPALTDDGNHIYERPFMIVNIQYEVSKWESHEANPEILKTFEDNMNAFPIKDMIGSVLEQNGLDNPITNVTWNMSDDSDYFKIQLTSDKPLNGSQLLCAEQVLDYLTVDSAYKANKDNHVFGKYMDTDDEFLRNVYNTFETRMRPRCNDLFKWKEHLMEVKAEPDIVLTNDDLIGISQSDELFI